MYTCRKIIYFKNFLDNFQKMDKNICPFFIFRMKDCIKKSENINLYHYALKTYMTIKV